jgi:outer membrane lipoprotein-sorting protein
MTSMPRYTQLLCVALGVVFPVSAAEPTLAEILARMDQTAAHFKALSANVEYGHHIEVLHEEDLQSGKILVKRPRPKDLHAKIAIDKPEEKVAVTDGNKVSVYYPHSGESQEVALGHHRSDVSMILMLGFGGTSRELQDAYKVTLGGTGTVAGESATRLELVPKSQDLLEEWKKIDLWISDKTGCTVQVKFYERGGDYTLITYTNVVTNPEIPDSAFKLDVPKGTKKDSLNKK